MLINILTHTPLYVWAILALLVWRGVIAMHDREMAVRNLFIIPFIMLAISLQDIAAKFGGAYLPLCAWAGGAVAVIMLVLKCTAAGVSAGADQGSVRVHGSKMPLAIMMGIFWTKYVSAVTLVIQPHASESSLFQALVCGLSGAFSGYFLGCLVRNVSSWQLLKSPHAAVLTSPARVGEAASVDKHDALRSTTPA